MLVPNSRWFLRNVNFINKFFCFEILKILELKILKFSEDGFCFIFINLTRQDNKKNTDHQADGVKIIFTNSIVEHG